MKALMVTTEVTAPPSGDLIREHWGGRVACLILVSDRIVWIG